MEIIVILNFLLAIFTAQGLQINTRGLKEDDLIEWKGVISSKAKPAQFFIFAPYKNKRYSVMKMEIQGVRRSLAFSSGIVNRETMQGHSGKAVCNMGDSKVAPNLEFRALIRILRSRVMIYWNGNLAFTFRLTSHHQRLENINQIRVFGLATTERLRILKNEHLAEELEEPSCGQVAMGLEVPDFCPKRKMLARIVGGISAKPGQQPWQAALRRKTTSDGEPAHICGATLIGHCWAITAAHCIPSVTRSTLNRLVLRVGDYYNRDNTTHSNDSRVESSQDLEIETVVVHKAFERYPSPTNDVALIKLRTCATYSDFVKPACLPQNENQFTSNNSVCSVSGWGASDGEQDTNDYPACLKNSYVRIKENSFCNSSYGPDLFNNGSMLCANGLSGGDTCSGDSGGPLICFGFPRQIKFTLWGITSWGTGCGVRSQPGVYTRLASYLRWIYIRTKLSPDDEAVTNLLYRNFSSTPERNGFCLNSV